MALAKRNGWFKTSGARAGDLVMYGTNGYSVHTGLAAPAPGALYYAHEANTSSGNAGSQANGDGVFHRGRGRSWIVGWVDMVKVIDPERFGSLADARAFGERFFSYYNHEHRHSGIGLHTPASVHFGTATEVRTQRQQTLNAAYTAHPERFGNRRPQPPKLPAVAWINQPSQEALIQTA